MSGRDSSAAIIKDGRLVFACREERLNREKKTRKFPMLSIQACLSAVGAELKDVDEVGISWNPAINLERFNSAQSSVARFKPEHYYAVPNHLFMLMPQGESLLSEQQFLFEGGHKLNIAYVNHHLCHAADSFFQSRFDNAAIMVLDAYGEKDSVTMAVGRGNSIEVLRTIQFPHSIGSFYGALTQYLGYTPDSDEWKVMGAAPYGDPNRYYAALRGLIALTDDGGFELDLSYFNFPTFSRPAMCADKMAAILGEARGDHEELSQRHYDIAAATQKVTEDVVFHMLKSLHRTIPLENLCLSGGVAMNCVLNGKANKATPFKNVHVGYSADDGGTAIGAALYLAAKDPAYRRSEAQDSYLGPSFSDAEIESELAKFGLAYSKVQDSAREAALRISRGEVVGWFQGRMEFGERALGNRSILADPRNPEMKHVVNSAIKYREGFRPFAPAILEESMPEYFEEKMSVRFMEKTLAIRQDKRAAIPAVTHVDGSGRVQTVSREVNPLFWNLLTEFHANAGVPVVMNTSFNLQGEPIVCSPKDAIRTFYSSGLNALFLGNALLTK
jgi:carbamoyltransferase